MVAWRRRVAAHEKCRKRRVCETSAVGHRWVTYLQPRARRRRRLAFENSILRRRSTPEFSHSQDPPPPDFAAGLRAANSLDCCQWLGADFQATWLKSKKTAWNAAPAPIRRKGKRGISAWRSKGDPMRLPRPARAGICASAPLLTSPAAGSDPTRVRALVWHFRRPAWRKA
jgi:hypothetical protein